jgi:hypothetical protein
MGSPHLEEELIGGDCRSRSPLLNPLKDARIIGGKGEEASSRGSTMEMREIIKNDLQCPQTAEEEAPFIANQNMAARGKVQANRVESQRDRALHREFQCISWLTGS